VKAPLNFFTLSFVSLAKEKKFQHVSQLPFQWRAAFGEQNSLMFLITQEYVKKSLNTVRVTLALMMVVIFSVDTYNWVRNLYSSFLKILLLDGFYSLGIILVIVWSYYNFDHFAKILQPVIGFGIFIYLLLSQYFVERQEHVTNVLDVFI
jgi:hypothetical protein